MLFLFLSNNLISGVNRSMGTTDVDVTCPMASKAWRKSPSVTLYHRLPMKIFILIPLDRPCEVLRAPILKSLSYRAHTVKQLVDYNGCYTGIDIGHGVGNDQLVVMN